MVNIYLRQYHDNGDEWLKCLCTVYDNESLGIVERLLIEKQWSYTVIPTVLARSKKKPSPTTQDGSDTPSVTGP